MSSDDAGRRGAQRGHRQALAIAMFGNVVWGLQPLYWPLVKPTPTVEIVAHRALWTAVAMAAVLLVWRRWGWVSRTVRQPRALATLAVASVLLSASWGVYIVGVNLGRVVETSLGLFVGPLVTVLFGVLFLRERLRRAQWLTVVVAGAGVALLTVDYGHVPWIALVLGGAFAGYALVKKRLAAPAVEGFALETVLIAPLALGYVVWSFTAGEHTFGTVSVGHTALLVGSGALTAIPLVAYATAINRVPLVSIGVLMFVNPGIQFLIGVFVRHEPMTAARWGGFVLVWLALVVFAIDSVRATRLPATEGVREENVETVEPAKINAEKA